MHSNFVVPAEDRTLRDVGVLGSSQEIVSSHDETHCKVARQTGAKGAINIEIC